MPQAKNSRIYTRHIDRSRPWDPLVLRAILRNASNLAHCFEIAALLAAGLVGSRPKLFSTLSRFASRCIGVGTTCIDVSGASQRNSGHLRASSMPAGVHGCRSSRKRQSPNTTRDHPFWTLPNAIKDPGGRRSASEAMKYREKG